MSKKFNELAEANKENFDEHPELTTAVLAVAVIGTVIVFRKVARKIAKNDLKSHMEAGKYAKK